MFTRRCWTLLQKILLQFTTASWAAVLCRLRSCITVQCSRKRKPNEPVLKHMKNPRALPDFDLPVAPGSLPNVLTLLTAVSNERPPDDSLFWKLWNKNFGLAKKTLGTPYMKGIAKGNLNPVTYGGSTVSDAYYCFHGVDSYKVAIDRTSDPTLKAFLHSKLESYQKYNKDFPKKWHLKDATGIIPSDVIKGYSEFEREVAFKMDPIYTLIAMLPCERLWGWMGVQLSPPTQDNMYSDWIRNNASESARYRIGNFLEHYRKNHPGAINEEKASDIYHQAMQFEYRNFANP